MPSIWAVIGDANMRKSSTIRALTGVGNRSVGMHIWDVDFQARGIVGVFICKAGLQELRITAATFIQMINNYQQNNNFTDVMVALRYQNHGHDAQGQPLGNADTYLSDFINAGWIISGCALLGAAAQGLAPMGFGTVVNIPHSNITPSNSNAAQLRMAWMIN
jgi:hypothetical protein